VLKSSEFMNIDFKTLRKIIQIFEGSQLSELEIEREGVKIKLKKGVPVSMVTNNLSIPQVEASLPQHERKEEKKAEENLVELTSPMVGTFYRAPAPDAPPFVEEGDEVNEDDVVCIIEAMKIMNEIKAERKGRIKKILVENGAPVEFGQPLFLIEPLP